MGCNSISPSNGYEEIGFIFACFAAQAVNNNEVQKWADLRLESCDDPDLLEYYAELSVFKGKLLDMYKLIDSINYSWDGYGKYDTALIGIAFRRGIKPFEEHTTRDEAIKGLNKFPEIEQLFRETFPFILFPEE